MSVRCQVWSVAVAQNGAEIKKTTSKYYHCAINYYFMKPVLDTRILAAIFTKFCKQFKSEFDVNVLEKLSLPAISENILWQLYDIKSCPKVFSFNQQYAHLNECVRKHIMGGPAIVFHR